MSKMKVYLPVVIALFLVVGTIGRVFAQKPIPDDNSPLPDVCGSKYLKDADRHYNQRLIWQESVKIAQNRYKTILEKCPDTLFRYEMEAKVLGLDEELADHSFQIARYYMEEYWQTGRGGLGAKSRLKEIVEKMPHYSRITEVKVWLEEISRSISMETNN
jgi:outer membrane protein assembly factor BamD (BamD/ComL family)